MRVSCGVAGIVLATLTGCSTRVVHVDMDAARLAMAGSIARIGFLACDYRLADVVDARTDGGRAGGLSENAFQFDDAAGTVRAQLLAAGLSAAADAPGPAVHVRIAQLYLTQSLTTKIPVAVYRVTVAQEAPFVLRSQQASMNWNGTRNEAYAAYAQAMADVNRQLVARLNARCAVL